MNNIKKILVALIMMNMCISMFANTVSAENNKQSDEPIQEEPVTEDNNKDTKDEAFDLQEESKEELRGAEDVEKEEEQSHKEGEVVLKAKSTTLASGTCGDNVIWTLDSNGLLIISGSGEMTSFSSAKNVPWYDKRDLIKTISIEQGVTSIGYYAFSYCTSLTDVTLPSSLTSIEGVAFNSCTSLISIMIPKSVTNIDYRAFWFCSNLTSINVDSNNSYYSSVDGLLLSKDKTQLYQCPEGKTSNTFTIPSTVNSIQRSAFYNCEKLTTCYIPNSVARIEKYAFKDCSSLKSITIPGSVKTIEESAFNGCTSLSDVTISEGVTSIGESAFWSKSMTNISIPKSVSYIGGGAFNFCDNLKTINVDSNNEYYSSSEGILFNKDHTEIICYPAKKEGSTYTVPSSVTKISDYAFVKCSYLEEISLSNSVTSIGFQAFNYCNSLTSIKIPSSVTTIMGNSVFPEKNDFVIYGEQGSQAETYANTHNITFKSIQAEGNSNIINTSIVLSVSSYTYDGTEKKPGVTVKDGSTTLTLGTHYTVSYADNTNAGTATVTVTGKGNYTGTVKKTFTISAKGISNATVTLSSSSYTSYTYDGTEKKPGVTVKDGSTTLTLGTHYTVSYADNVNAGTATVTVTGKGNYTGTVKKTFTISAKSISNAAITVSPSTYTYDGTEKKPGVTVKDGNTTLTLGTHYTVSYADNINAGTATVTVTGKGNYTGTKQATFTIEKPQYVTVITVKKDTYVKTYGSAAFKLEAEVNSKGKLTYKTSNSKIATVKAGEVTLKKTYGTVTITITSAAKGNYPVGTKTVSIEIVPKKMKLTSLTSKKKGIVIATWKKDKTASYYQIQGSYDKSFTDAKTTKSAVKKYKVTDGDCKSGKTLYFRIRAVSTKNGTHYGAWSNVKSVKVK